MYRVEVSNSERIKGKTLAVHSHRNYKTSNGRKATRSAAAVEKTLGVGKVPNV